jgi:anti-anti-sigma regulatory factor
MILDDVLGLARRVAPRKAGGERPGPRYRTRTVPVGRVHTRELTGMAAIPRDLVCLQPTSPIVEENAGALVDTVLRQVCRHQPLPFVVVLTLDATPQIDDKGSEALVELFYSLRASGMRLYVAAVTTELFDHLRVSGATNRMGAGAVHLALRMALLSAFEDLPGPAVTTRNVLAALDLRLTPLAI